MECPHCQTEIDVKPHSFALGEDQDGTWQVSSLRCSACDRLIVDIGTKEGRTFPVWPASSRPTLSEDVPSEFSAEYHTASRILADSPEASAAISRRLLHRFLASHVGAGGGGLAEQVRRAADSEQIPPYLDEALRALSRVAKFSSEGHKSLHPEALTAPEPEEPEWLLDVLQSLFELYFVQPARMRRRLDALEERIGPATEPAAAGRLETLPEDGSPSAAETTTEQGHDHS
jgi:hypothetical protein